MHQQHESRESTDEDASSEFDLEAAPFIGGEEHLPYSTARYAAQISTLVLPSFMHGFVYTKMISCGRKQINVLGTELIEERKKETVFLDGMRGLASLCVFIEHFLVPFWGTIFYAYGGHKDATLFQLPVIRLLYSGSPMVCIFFVISGAALSLKPVQLVSKGDRNSAYRAIESMLLRRPMRLFGPAFISSLFLMIAAHLHLCDIQSAVEYEGPAEILDEFWMLQPQFVPSLWDQMKEWFDFFTAKVLIPSIWRGTTTGRDYGDLEHVEYGSQLWTIGVEYWCSVLLYTALFGTVRLRPSCKMAVIAILICFAILVSRWDMMMFLYGSLLANTLGFQEGPSPKTRTVFRDSFFVFLQCVGLLLASFPELGGPQSLGFSWLSVISTNPRVWQSLGAAMIVLAGSNLNLFRRFFSCNILLYLGRISFALYLVHMPILITVGWRLVPSIWSITGRDSQIQKCTGLLVAFSIVLLLVVWAADLFCRFVDKPCIALARKFEARFLLPAR